MNQERLMKVLCGPVITEKSTMIGEKHNQLAFVVIPDATKAEVKAAVEKLFNVKVESVQILNTKGKRSDVRKAYVALAEGQEINFAQEVK